MARPPIALLPSQIQAWEQMLHTGRARGPRAKPDAKAELRDGYGFKREDLPPSSLESLSAKHAQKREPALQMTPEPELCPPRNQKLENGWK